MRVISLVPSITETLVAWGIQPVACTRFCEQPELAHVGGTKDPDLDAVIALRPDLVVMDTEENKAEDHQRLTAAGISVHVTEVRRLDDVAPALRALALAVGLDEHQLSDPTPTSSARPPRLRAFVPIWRRPWMALGVPTYGASLLASLGVTTICAARGPYPEVTLEQAVAEHPEVVLAPSEPYPFGPRQLPELETVAPTVLVDGKDLFWWGVRTKGARDRLAGVLDALLSPGPGVGTPPAAP